MTICKILLISYEDKEEKDEKKNVCTAVGRSTDIQPVRHDCISRHG